MADIVKDVRLGGTSIVDTSGIANIPYAASGTRGVAQIGNNIDVSNGIISAGIDVSDVFTAGTLPSGYTLASLQGKFLYAKVNDDFFCVTYEYDSSGARGLFYYVDLDFDGNVNVVKVIIS